VRRTDIPRWSDELTVSEYLDAGGDPNAVLPNSSWTLLHLAAEFQDLELVQRLVSTGADLNRPDEFGQTALHFAVDIDIDGPTQQNEEEKIDFSTTKLLLALGASPWVVDHRGRTARGWAEGYGPKLLKLFDECCGHLIND